MTGEEGEEEILLETKPSRINFLGKYIGAIFLVIISILLAIDYFGLSPKLPMIYGYNLLFLGAILCLIIALFLVLKAELERYRIRYQVSRYRVFKIVGILKKSKTSIPFQKIERTDVVQSALDRLLGIGTARVDTGEEHFFIEGVPNPKEIEKLIFEEGIKKQSAR